jgi:hypothetical protein
MKWLSNTEITENINEHDKINIFNHLDKHEQLEEKKLNDLTFQRADFTILKNNIKREEELYNEVNSDFYQRGLFTDQNRYDYKLELISNAAYKKFLINKIFNNSLSLTEKNFDLGKKYKSLDLVSNVIKMYKNFNKSMGMTSRESDYFSSLKPPSIASDKKNHKQEGREEFLLLSRNLKGKNKKFLFKEFQESYDNLQVKIKEDTNDEEERREQRKKEMKHFISKNFYN